MLTVLAMLTGFVLSTRDAVGQTVKINPRPLTPQEKKSYPATTQLAGGQINVGIGQPLYLEALISTSYLSAVTGATWQVLASPPGSTATIVASPLTNDTYDVGDRNTYSVASRGMLVPDVACSYWLPSEGSVSNDYLVVLNLFLTNATIAVTNEFYGSKYIGLGDSTCVLCHGMTNTFAQTAHATAFKRKITGEAPTFKASCVSCHVVGYDTAAAATNGGFDDVALTAGWTCPTNLALGEMVLVSSTGWLASAGLTTTTNWASTNWAAVPTAVQNKANIQCESCHGPADRHKNGLGDPDAITVSLSAGNCAQCHDSMSHHAKNYEWALSGHAGPARTSSSSCLRCHITSAFISTIDPDYAGGRMPRSTSNEGITCVACHDPHETNSLHQIRTTADVNLGDPSVTNAPYVYPVAVVTNGGLGKLCMNCHKSRRTGEYYAITASVSSHFGPHYGVQGDMLAGANAIEYGMEMPSSRHLEVVEDSCVGCHMQETPSSGEASHKVGGHTFSLSYAGTNGTIHLTEACAECHGEVEDFNFGGEDYDRDGVVEGVQHEIEGLLEELALLLPPVGSTTVTPSSSYTIPQRKALYNYKYVEEDASHGVHNPKYAAAILQAAIDDLSGGIDVDRDGLLDSWEVTNFGSITNTTGSADSDGDGLSDAQEMALGTNPNVKDSDSDGVWDGAELSAGTDPLNIASVAETNAVVLLPALELGYMPETMGVTQQFQSIDVLTSGSWTNLGSPFVSSNAWFYQLTSTRTNEMKFFRVVTK